jgi:hypothetical protein
MDTNSKTTSLRYGGLVLALALAIAIVGASTFAEAAGFRDTAWGRDPVLPLCGFVLFFLFCMLLRFVFQLGFQIVSRLGKTPERPGFPITITLLACGTLCVLGALAVVWHGNTGGLNMSPSMNMPHNMPGAEMVPRLELSMQTTGSLSRPLVVCAALLIGVALLAIGVWSSLAPAPPSIAPKAVSEEGGAP